jgi:hypothetical protein
MNRTGWLVFVGVQAVGEVCAWSARYSLSALGPVLWFIGFVLLLPGNILGWLIVEKLLWKTGLTISQLTVLQMTVAVAINAVFWFLAARLLILFAKRPFEQKEL